MRKGVMCCPKCNLWKRWRLFSSDRIDRVCIKCGFRFRTLVDRKPGRRGMPRRFELRELPSYMPKHAIRKMVIELNKFETDGRRKRNQRLGYDDETFTKAAKLKKPPRASSGTAAGMMMANDPDNWGTWEENA